MPKIDKKKLKESLKLLDDWLGTMKKKRRQLRLSCTDKIY